MHTGRAGHKRPRDRRIPPRAASPSQIDDRRPRAFENSREPRSYLDRRPSILPGRAPPVLPRQSDAAPTLACFPHAPGSRQPSINAKAFFMARAVVATASSGGMVRRVALKGSARAGPS